MKVKITRGALGRWEGDVHQIYRTGDVMEMSRAELKRHKGRYADPEDEEAAGEVEAAGQRPPAEGQESAKGHPLPKGSSTVKAPAAGKAKGKAFGG